MIVRVSKCVCFLIVCLVFHVFVPFFCVFLLPPQYQYHLPLYYLTLTLPFTTLPTTNPYNYLSLLLPFITLPTTTSGPTILFPLCLDV